MTTRRDHIPFNRAFVTGREFGYMHEAIGNAHLAGNGPFSRVCRDSLEESIGSASVLLTPSCTAALEMSLILAEIASGDEVIVPSFTFVSCANAIVARGGTPVFVDIRPDTLCLDERLIESALSPRTRAIMPVHYAGIACQMDAIAELADRRGLVVIEDAAHAIGSTRRGRPLGGIGHLGALSFHETKNISCGEGGALLVNDPRYVNRAEIVQEKGTDRQRFFRGSVDKYTWVDVGSSYVLSDLAAAYLWAQLQDARTITATRMSVWERYHEAFDGLEAEGCLRRPVVPDACTHNAHMYYLVLPSAESRSAFIRNLAARHINAVFHYVPLHTSDAGRRYGRIAGRLEVTQSTSDCLVRLPLWAGLTEVDVERVVEAVWAFFTKTRRRARNAAA